MTWSFSAPWPSFLLLPGPSNTPGAVLPKDILLCPLWMRLTYSRIAGSALWFPHCGLPEAPCCIFFYQTPWVSPATQYMSQSTIPRNGMCFFQDPKRTMYLFAFFFVLGDTKCSIFFFLWKAILTNSWPLDSWRLPWRVRNLNSVRVCSSSSGAHVSYQGLQKAISCLSCLING